jgi:signal transduction histidine kinase
VFALHKEGGVQYFRRRQTYIEVEKHEGLTVTVLEDVTHFKKLDQLKSDFLAAVSHELRTPLTSLGMAIDLLLQEVPDPISAMQRDLLETAKGDQARLKKLVGNLLDLARLESGTYIPAGEPVHLPNVVEEALAPLRLPFQEKGVCLQTHVSSGLSPIVGDAQHLGWVITNLAGNALRYTPAGGQVSIAFQQVDETIQVAVHDTGSGIPEEALDTIFDMFVQLKASDETTPGSLGLGLALARRVVEAHGGRIWAESKPGLGSTFFFTLPTLYTSTDATGDANRYGSAGVARR